MNFYILLGLLSFNAFVEKELFLNWVLILWEKLMFFEIVEPTWAFSNYVDANFFEYEIA